MRNIISWVRATGGWIRSPFGDLPALRAEDSSAHQTWLILAGGIALVLSRASASELQSRYAAARQVYAIARARLHKSRLPKPDAELLRVALEEIGNLADPMTREAGRECLARCLERAARSRPAAAAAAATAPSSLTASHLSTQATSASDEDDVAATQIDLDLLFERSNRLRGTVAWARSTTFGPDT